MQIEMKARRAGYDFLILADGALIGRLADCESCHVFVSDDEELASHVAGGLEGDMSLREILGVIRRTYEGLMADRRSEVEHERSCEMAWLRAAEFDPEAAAEMAAGL